ncbi:MAG TPA: glycoside hydrolase family 9 protein [Anaeromyxobacter sp.]|nr:glycoside hydrolase family 9 protein [Anaeromyxobacter sp.]
MLRLDDQGCLTMPGLEVMLGHDDYPEGHQAGLTIVQNGVRVAANGDLRLDRTPGQWQPVPRSGPREVDHRRREIRLRGEFPDPARDGRGFNPLRYPDLRLRYALRVRPDGEAFRLRVDLEAPLPPRWVGKVGLNLELFPGALLGRSFAMDGAVGLFPRQANGPLRRGAGGEAELAPLAVGRRLAVAPESDRQRILIQALTPGELELLDGRGQHTNGWFVVRTAVPPGASERAIEWRIAPQALPGFRAAPVIQRSQVGYHPRQPKVAVVALDARDPDRPAAALERIADGGERETVREIEPREWGRFLRYRCLQLDFSEVREPGLYELRWGAVRSGPFPIGPEVYRRHVWQPTLEYFLPIQMCHLRVTDRHRVWHGACHLDDARMAPVDHRHLDGYAQGPSTLCAYLPGQHVPGLDRGGWHDAGDHDLRLESQVDTLHGLALAREEFGIDLDSTTVDQAHRLVELGRPDGRPDVLEQVEHGVLSVLGARRALGRLYRGIIEPTLEQYRWIGDPANVTDNRVFDPSAAPHPPPPIGAPGAPDDRWVFTEQCPERELQAAAGLAAAARVLRGYEDGLAEECRVAAQELWEATRGDTAAARAPAAVELLLATGDRTYADWLVGEREALAADPERTGWLLCRVLRRIGDPALTAEVERGLRRYAGELAGRAAETPYGVPYRPAVWGAGWEVQRLGMRSYYLHRAYPDLFPATLVLSALAFVLGCHPGDDPASFVSGVGSRSVTSAYGFQRAEGAHIPGGVVSGSALIRPDLVELKDWPHLWQQTEYVVGGGATDFLFLVLAAEALLGRG